MTENQERTEALGDQLRAKIASKFQTATFFAGFGFTMLSIQISILWTAPGALPYTLPFSIALMLASALNHCAAVVCLDALMMPKRFWRRQSSGRKPDPQMLQNAYLTDRDLDELHARMVFYWYRFVVVGTALGALSLLILLAGWGSVTRPQDLVWWTFAASAAAAAVFVAYLVWTYFVQRELFGSLMWVLGD